MLAAAVATLAFPVVSLIAALLLMSGQPGGRKRGQLKLWGWASVGWLLLQALVLVLFGWAVLTSGGASDPVIVP